MNIQLLQLSNEIWVDIKGYKNFYQISNFGRIRSVTRKIKKRRTLLELAKQFNCAECTIQQVVSRRTWKHVK